MQSSLILGTALFLAGAAFALSPWATPELGLGLGMVLGLSGVAVIGGPGGGGRGRAASRLLIQIAVVLLGFRMDLMQVAAAGGLGLVLAAGVVVAAVGLGLLVGRWLKTSRELTTLVSSGTAICGGSAIAAVGATIRAAPASMTVAIGTVFVFNAVALFAFPAIGEWLGLSPRQFGVWAGVAIHDVSSVVGAGASFRAGTPDGEAALETATVVKLARVLWIAPICVAAAWFMARPAKRDPAGDAAGSAAADDAGGDGAGGDGAAGDGAGGDGAGGDGAAGDGAAGDGAAGDDAAGDDAGGDGAANSEAAPGVRKLRWNAALPWYVILFLVAAAARTLVPELSEYAPQILLVARRAMTLALFLIGAGLTRHALLAVGWRPLALGAALWLVLAGGMLGPVSVMIP